MNRLSALLLVAGFAVTVVGLLATGHDSLLTWAGIAVAFLGLALAALARRRAEP